MSNIDMMLMNIAEIADKAVELAREEGRREAFDVCEKALRYEINKDGDVDVVEGLEHAIYLIGGLR